MASATPRAGPPAAGACDPGFLEWCRAGGVRVDGVAPAFVADGWRGVVATRAIGPGDVLVATPAPLLLTGRSARRDAALGPLLRQPQHAGLSDHQVLAAHLLHEASKGPASAWHLYISQLPRSYTTLCCFPAAAAEALQLSHAVQAARDAEAKAKADWRGSWPLLQDLGLAKKWCCWAAWQWAASTVLSRTMYFPNDTAGALTPFGDLFNYRAPPAPFIPRLHLPQPARVAASPALSCQPSACAAEGSDTAKGAEGEGAGAAETGACPESGTEAGCRHGGSELSALAQLHISNHSEQQPVGHRQHEDAGSGAGATARDCSHSDHGVGLAASGDNAASGGGGFAPGPAAGSPSAGDAMHESAGRAAAEAAAGGAAQPGVVAGQGPAAACDELQHPEAAPEPQARRASSSTAGSEEGPEVEGEERAAGCGDGTFDSVAQEYRLYSWAHYEPGEQVFLCYGRHTNLELLEVYGFCLPPGAGPGDNPHEAAYLPPELFAENCRREPPAAADCWLHWDGRPSWGLLRSLRVSAASPAELRERGHRAHEGRAISREGDAMCAARLRAACARQLAALPTSLEEDEAELARLRAAGARAAAACRAAAAGAECFELAVAWRVGYKRILHRGCATGL